MMLLKKKTIIGLFLCTLVFSSSVPLLMGIQASPEEVFGGEVITLSQVNSTVALNASLAQELNEDANQSVRASAEVYSFSVVKGQPIIVRGVRLEDFTAIENATLEGDIDNAESFAVVGRDLSRRADLKIGDYFVLTGSSTPKLYQMRVDAIYDSELGSDDLLIPLERSWGIAGLGEGQASVIRVKTENETALVEDLEEKEEKVVVNTGDGVSSPINTNTTLSEEEQEKQRLAIKYLDTEQFKSSNGSYVSLFVQEGERNVKIVIITFLILDGALTFIGATAIMARAIIERRGDIGILTAIGADRKYIRFQIIKDVLLISIPASLLGVGAGYVIVRLIASTDLLMMFGQTIQPLLSSGMIIGTLVTTIFICVVSGIFINEAIMRATPQKMMQDSDQLEDPKSAKTLVETLEVDA